MGASRWAGGRFREQKSLLGLLFSLAQSILGRQALDSLTAKGGIHMLKKVAAVLFMVVLVFSVSAPGFAQGAAKKARVEGRVVRSSTDESTLTVSTEAMGERMVHYDASTKWVSQYHGEKKANTIDASKVKDGDYVICLGKNEAKGEFHATMISKRLSHSPK
jgi:hypothetical protein